METVEKDRGGETEQGPEDNSQVFFVPCMSSIKEDLNA
jgi:hypothetical protein